MSQIINITSEALQATIRRLLPSQQGFGEDLQASNVIIPTIDLTPTAEGSEVRADLQTATAYGSQTAFTANNGTTVIANSGGFYRIWAGITVRSQGAAASFAEFNISDGLTSRTLWKTQLASTSAVVNLNDQVDFVHFLAPGESISATTGDVNSFVQGTVRQIADVNGNLVNPSGFTPQ